MSSRRPSPLLRSWLPICTATTICLAVLPPAAPGKPPRYAAALAQDACQLKPDYSRFKTVDDILAGSAFKKVNLKEYPNAIKKGRALVLFYDNIEGDSSSGRLAMVTTEISKQYPSINYIALPRDVSLRDSTYIKLGFEVSPDFMIYENGKMVFRNPAKFKDGKQGGGPKAAEEHIWQTGLSKDMERLFPSLRR